VSLTVRLSAIRKTDVFDWNITHNLTKMADEAGIYMYLWNPEKVGITKAEQLIEPLTKGLQLLKSDPRRFNRLNPDNGWGTYEGLVEFIESYLLACIENPDAEIYIHK
jgi:hypothetical protein